MSLGLNATLLKFCQVLKKLKLYRQIFNKSPNIKFHENPSSRSRVVPCGRTDGQRDMTKLPVVLRNCANAPTKYIHYKQTYVQKN